MVDIKNPNNPLETALNQLDLQGTLILMNLLSQKALFMQQEELKNRSNVSKILKPTNLIT